VAALMKQMTVTLQTIFFQNKPWELNWRVPLRFYSISVALVPGMSHDTKQTLELHELGTPGQK
jgi:hypothetical protein